MLVTERPGRLRIVGADGRLSAPLKGVPEVYESGQGGLLDVAIDPNFANNRLVYLSYAEAHGGLAATSVARGRLADDRLDDVQVIFRQRPKVERLQSFRLAAGVRAGRHAVRHAGRALTSVIAPRT